MVDGLVSVVIPVYNGASYLEETYNRIRESKEKDFEIIFVNDGSTDHSLEVLQALAKRDVRILILNQENKGIAEARNYGMQKANGEFICFVDQDDFVKPDMFSLLKSDLEETQADFVKATTGRCYRKEDGTWEEQGIVDRHEVQLLERNTPIFENYMKTLVMRDISFHPECKIEVSIWSGMFRTRFLKEHKIQFEAFCDYEDDWLFSVEAFSRANRVCVETKTIYSWRINMKSESHNRVYRDRYIENFYIKHKGLRCFLLDALMLAQTTLTKKESKRLHAELQKQTLLWALSNETGRGIDKHTLEESTDIMKEVVAHEKEDGLCENLNRYPLYISVAGASGKKKIYYILRDKFLTFLLLHNKVGLAVRLNRKYLHGRWHI